jgi:hypothetical protein
MAQQVEKWRSQAEKWGSQYQVPSAIILACIHHESFGDQNAGGDKVNGHPTSFGLVQFQTATANDVLTNHRELQTALGVKSITEALLYDPNINLALAAAHMSDNFKSARYFNPAIPDWDGWALMFMAHQAGPKYLKAAGEVLGPDLTWQAAKQGFLSGAIRAAGKRPLDLVFFDAKTGGPGSVEQRMNTAVSYGYTEEKKGKGVTPPVPAPSGKGLLWVAVLAAAGVAAVVLGGKKGKRR